jgi:cytochrome c peroxidase
VLALAACGGGGGSGSSSSGGSSSSSSGGVVPPPPPPATNRPPTLAKAIANQPAIHLHAFDFDITQAGTTFTDPDGDLLKYDIRIGHTYNPHSDPDPPRGLRIEGTHIRGAPEEVGVAVVNILVTDPSGQSANAEFSIIVAPNASPTVVNAPADMIVNVGDDLDLDAAMNGATFSDPDGDALSYQVAFRGATGLVANGSRVQGRLNAAGVVEVTVTARDAYGGTRDDIFQIAAPAPLPPPPRLPLAAYTYRDEALPLPFLFKLSSELQIPMWDTQPADNRTTDAGAALGRVLFHDKRLSITNTLSCASCHHQDHAFASDQRFDVGALGIPLTRNSMGLANARYNISSGWFADMRAGSIRQAARDALENPQEMGGTMSLVEAKVRDTPFYAPLFLAAFGSDEVTGDRIMRAIEQYVQALISYRSKFDDACVPMDNVSPNCGAVLNAQELRGLELFEGSGNQNCSTCHRGPSMANEWHANNGLDSVLADLGIANPAHMRDGRLGKFRAASLRNIARTAPYMHDGRFATLREVIDHYDHGVQDTVDLDGILRETTGGVRRLNLTESDKLALEAFLNTLTDEEMLADSKFSDPFE